VINFPRMSNLFFFMKFFQFQKQSISREFPHKLLLVHKSIVLSRVTLPGPNNSHGFKHMINHAFYLWIYGCIEVNQRLWAAKSLRSE